MSASAAIKGAGIGRGTPGPGRPKGVTNKLTGDIKAMVITALHTAGGADYLARQAEENPAAFMSLVGRVLPLQLQGDPDAPLLAAIRLVAVRPPEAGTDAGTKTIDGDKPLKVLP